jgi:hypothetical protein
MVCVYPARSRIFADQWQYEVRIPEPRDQPTRRTSEFAIFPTRSKGLRTSCDQKRMREFLFRDRTSE